MTLQEDLKRAEGAKAKLAKEYRAKPWCTGVGIARGPKGFELRLNVNPATGPRREDLPAEFEGFPVQVVRIEEYKPRSPLPGGE